jgi:hypothetical protein
MVKNPAYIREYGMTLLEPPTISITLHWATWNTAVDTETTQRRYRVVGTVCNPPIRLQSGDTIRPLYNIIQLEDRYNCGNESWYTNRLLIGDIIDVNHQTLPFTVSHGAQGLWCGKCWADDMYENGSGGLALPYYMHGEYYTSLEAVPSCIMCGSSYRPYDAECLEPLKAGEAWIFSAVYCRLLPQSSEGSGVHLCSSRDSLRQTPPFRVYTDGFRADAADSGSCDLARPAPLFSEN